MAKWANDSFMDAALEYVRANCDLMTVCTSQPTTYAEAITTFKLADVAMTVNTDYTPSNGDVSGRKVTVAAKNGVPIDTSGTALHLALVKTGDTTLRYVTTVTSQVLTAGGTVDIPAWDIEVAAPA